MLNTGHAKPAQMYEWQMATENADWPQEHFFANLYSFDDKMWISDPFVGNWVSEDGVDWEEFNPSIDINTADATIVPFKDMLFAVGDPNDSKLRLQFWRSTDGINWNDITISLPQIDEWAPINFPRFFAHGTVFRDQIWLIEESTANHAGVLWHSHDGIEWRFAATELPWQPREYFHVEVFNDEMYVIGGRRVVDGEIAILDDVWRSRDGLNWFETPGSSTPAEVPWAGRDFFETAVYDGRLWLMGGASNDDPLGLNDVWFSDDGIVWFQQFAEANWPPRGAFNAVEHNDKLFIMGGKVGPDQFLNDVWYMQRSEE
jgi:hypothetical protein